MTLPGTVIKGAIVLDGAPELPEGARVSVAFEPSDDVGPPPEAFGTEDDLQLLRDALQEADAGRGRPFDEVMAEIAAEFRLPPIRR